MNREIKFRIYESPNMYYLSNPEIMDNGLWFSIEKSSDPDNHINGWNEQKIMQFTGLKDKNGKEIYEGDHIKIQLPLGGFWGNVYTERIGEVKYEPDHAGYIIEWHSERNQHHIQLDCDIALTSEILGNKYQNHQNLS